MKQLFLAFTLAMSSSLAMAGDLTIGDLEFTNLQAFETAPTATTAAGYFTLINHGEADRLLSAESAYGKTELHNVTVNDAGIAKMFQMEDGIEIPSEEPVTFERGAKHVMFIGIEAPFVEGEEKTVTLIFEKAGPVDVTFDVVKGKGMMKSHEMHKMDPAMHDGEMNCETHAEHMKDPEHKAEHMEMHGNMDCPH